MPPDGPLSWPAAVDHQMTRLPPEHLAAGWYIVLVVAIVVAVEIGLRRWLPQPPLTAEKVGAELHKVLKSYINGDLREIKAQLARMDAKQDEHAERLARVETLTERSPAVPHHARVRTPK